MALDWIFNFQPAAEHDVAAFENDLGFKLPEDYREFLKTLNGGGVELHPKHYKKFGEQYPFQISEFFLLPHENVELLAHKNAVEILKETVSIEQYSIRYLIELGGDTPPWLLLFGSENISSRRFAMDLRPEELGTIYLYDLDFVKNPNPPFKPEEFMDDADDLEDAERLYREWVSAYFYIAPSFSALLKMFDIPI